MLVYSLSSYLKIYEKNDFVLRFDMLSNFASLMSLATELSICYMLLLFNNFVFVIITMLKVQK